MSVLLGNAIQARKLQKVITVFKVLTIIALAVVALATGVIIGSGTQTIGRIEFLKTQITSLFVGIMGGVLTTFLLWYANKRFEQFWQKLVDGVNNDIKVAGIWVEKYQPVKHKEELQKQELILDLRQNGTAINGTIKADDTASCPREERKGLRVFDVLGQSKNEMVGLDCILRSDTKKGRVQYLLRFAGDGSRLVGWTTYFDIQNEILNAAACEFYRIEDAEDADNARKELNENRDAPLEDISNGVVN